MRDETPSPVLLTYNALSGYGVWLKLFIQAFLRGRNNFEPFLGEMPIETECNMN